MTGSRLLIFCDGTTNMYDAAHTTNVVKLHKCVAPFAEDGSPQTPKYIQGVGTKLGNKFLGMTVGRGLFKRVRLGYQYVSEALAKDSTTRIGIIGFSRGAYTARSLAGMIGTIGIVKPEKQLLEEAEYWYQKRHALRKKRNVKLRNTFFKWRAEASPDWCANSEDQTLRRKQGLQAPDVFRIDYIGLWDTVKSVGVLEFRHKWHNHDLSEHVRSARHAAALDERRKSSH